MKAGTLLLILKEVIAMMETRGILLPTGDFDPLKLDTIQEDIEFAIGIEEILKTHGLAVPEKVDKIIAILPLLASILQ